MNKSTTVSHDPHIIRRTIFTLAFALVAYFFNYMMNAILASWLGAELFGDYTAGIYALTVTAVFVLIGMDNAVVRFIPEYVSSRNWGTAAGYLRHNFRLLRWIGFSVFFLGIVLSVGLYFFHKADIFSYETIHPFYLFAWATPFVALNTYFSKLLSGTNRVFLSLVSLYIAPQLILIIILSILKILSIPIHIHEAMFSYIVTLVLILFGQSIASYYALPPEILKSKPSYNPSWTSIAIQLLITSFLTGNILNMVIVLSEIFDPNEKNTGILSVVIAVCSIIWYIYTGIVTLMSPQIAPAVMQNDKNKLQHLLNVMFWTMLLVHLTLLATAILYGKLILLHFGPEFVVGYSALIIYVVGSAFAFMTGLALPLLQFSGNHHYLFTINIVGCLLLLVTCGFMSYFFGIIGSILSTCIVRTVISLYSSLKVRKKFGIKPFVFF